LGYGIGGRIKWMGTGFEYKRRCYILHIGKYLMLAPDV
jgi:hypothetical protein